MPEKYIIEWVNHWVVPFSASIPYVVLLEVNRISVNLFLNLIIIYSIVIIFSCGLLIYHHWIQGNFLDV